MNDWPATIKLSLYNLVNLDHLWWVPGPRSSPDPFGFKDYESPPIDLGITKESFATNCFITFPEIFI